MTTRTRLVAGATAAVVLLAAGLFVGFRLVVDSINGAIPQADLFGVALPGTTAPSGSASTPAPDPGAPEGSDIQGPLNILLSGEDTRIEAPGWVPHADSVMIMHINADHTHAYVVSLPRDLLVDIPAYGPSGSGATNSKLTNAMAFGSRVAGTIDANTHQGFGLVAQVVSQYTGIDHFDAGALVSFNGLVALTNALEGIDIYVDTYVQSIHMRPEGYEREWCNSCEHQATGPQATYNVGMMHMVGWQVLDYSRQRYGLPSGAYDRERHQRQIIKAMVSKIFSFDLATHPFVAAWVLRACGEALTLDLRGKTLEGYAYALRTLKPEAVTLVGLPGSGVSSGGAYIGEALAPIQADYFAALRADTLDSFLAAHPELINDPR